MKTIIQSNIDFPKDVFVYAHIYVQSGKAKCMKMVEDINDKNKNTGRVYDGDVKCNRCYRLPPSKYYLFQMIDGKPTPYNPHSETAISGFCGWCVSSCVKDKTKVWNCDECDTLFSNFRSGSSCRACVKDGVLYRKVKKLLDNPNISNRKKLKTKIQKLIDNLSK